jgi:hypothetical protein
MEVHSPLPEHNRVPSPRSAEPTEPTSDVPFLVFTLALLLLAAMLLSWGTADWGLWN